MLSTAAGAEARLAALGARLPERRWLRFLLAALLYGALVSPFVWSQLSKPDWVWLIDLGVYREAGRHVLAGDGEVYRFVTQPLLLPFTYPPFPALLATWLAAVPKVVAGVLWTVAELATVVGITGYAFRPVLRRTRRGRPFLLAVLAAAMFWLLPVRDVAKFGQVDVFILALVLADCAARRPRWPRGLLVGLATAIKLTPGLFVPYLWLSGRRRAAAVAAATFVAAQGVAAAVMPGASREYWTSVIFASDRLGSNGGTSNESIRGMLLRLHADPTLTAVLWGVLAAVVLAVGARRALAAHRAGDEIAAVAVVGLVSVAVSPVSWIHHLVWVVLVVAVLGDDFTVPRRVVGALGLTVFFVLRLPWWGAAIGIHGGPLDPARLVQDSFGIAVLVLVCVVPWRARRRVPAAPPLVIQEYLPAIGGRPWSIMDGGCLVPAPPPARLPARRRGRPWPGGRA